MKKLEKYWPYCTRNRAITNTYMKKGKDMHDKYITANVKTRNIYISKTKN